MVKKKWAWLVGIIALVLVIGLVFFGYLIFYPKQIATEYLLRISKGGSLSSIATQLQKDGVIYSRHGLILVGRILGVDKKIVPSIFRFSGQLSTWDIVNKIELGPKKITVRIIEGSNLKQIRMMIDSLVDVEHSTKNFSEQELLKLIDKENNYTHLEGLLFPSSYYYFAGTDDKNIYLQSFELMQKELKRQWDGRKQQLPYKNSYELLIVASLIEKETGHPADRDLIAAVFVNRLKKGMKLQTDPTVIYGMGEKYDGNIRKKDLLTDTPYNTYTRYGLPPTPIAMPSLASLKAAAHPADVTYLYFVSKNNLTGKSHFSHTLPEHNNAVRQYLLPKK